MKKVLFTLLDLAVVAVCILSSIFRWYIPGWIALAFAVLFFICEVFQFVKKVSPFGLIAVLASILVFVCCWLPIALTGFKNLGIFEIIVMYGAACALFTIPFHYIKK